MGPHFCSYAATCSVASWCWMSAQVAMWHHTILHVQKVGFHRNLQKDHSLIKTTGKWALSSVQLTVGSTVGATERNKPFPRKVCITACCAIFRTKHCVNRNGGMHSCAARQEGNYTLTQSSDSHSWSSAHKKHTGTVPSWTQAVRPTQNTDLQERFLIALNLNL